MGPGAPGQPVTQQPSGRGWDRATLRVRGVGLTACSLLPASSLRLGANGAAAPGRWLSPSHWPGPPVPAFLWQKAGLTCALTQRGGL